MQRVVESHENEILAAPKVLACLDLCGQIVIGDALQTPRELSAQIKAAQGDYIWFVKDNQPQLHADTAEWFAAETHTKGFRSVPKDFQIARSITKGHGRREERTLTTSSLLTAYIAWPGVAQVFQLQRRTVNTHTGAERQQVIYGLTSLSAQAASAERLNGLVRQYWGIENGLHYRRDKSLHEDAIRMSDPNSAQNMATHNNLIVALVLQHGWRYLPTAHPADFVKALAQRGGQGDGTGSYRKRRGGNEEHGHPVAGLLYFSNSSDGSVVYSRRLTAADFQWSATCPDPIHPPSVSKP
jgi:predicted transposase YbfD/YdcC